MSATALPLTGPSPVVTPPALRTTVERPARTCAVIPMGLANDPPVPTPLPGLPVRALRRRTSGQ